MVNVLYHGTSSHERLTELRVQAYKQERNGVTARWLFATHRRDQAFAYTLPKVDGFMATLGKDEDGPLALFYKESGEQFARRPIDGQVFSFPAAGFNRVAASREWVRDTNLPLTQPGSLLARVTSAADVMAQGVQIFTLQPGASPAVLERDSASFLFRKGCLSEEIAAVLAQPDSLIVWENEKAGVGMDPTLKAQVAALRRSTLAPE